MSTLSRLILGEECFWCLDTPDSKFYSQFLNVLNPKSPFMWETASDRFVSLLMTLSDLGRQGSKILLKCGIHL